MTEPMTGPHPHNFEETWRDDGKCIVKSCNVYCEEDCSDWESEGGWTPKDDTPKRKRNR